MKKVSSRGLRDTRNCSFLIGIIYLGTEAAATGVVIMERVGCALGAKPQPIEFKVDRPFLFFIREVERDLILFSGKFLSP
jgi:serine protease inhibitor